MNAQTAPLARVKKEANGSGQWLVYSDHSGFSRTVARCYDEGVADILVHALRTERPVSPIQVSDVPIPAARVVDPVLRGIAAKRPKFKMLPGKRKPSPGMPKGKKDSNGNRSKYY
jgi:hypothetical protein